VPNNSLAPLVLINESLFCLLLVIWWK